MTDVRVAINGFGRIGRLAFRQMFVADGYEVVAINDLTDPKMLANLLKYDSAQGKWAGHTIEAGEDNIVVDGKKITIYKEPDANKLPWGQLDVDVVLECTGFYTKKDKAMKAAESDSFAYNTDPIVSSDVIGETHGSIFDSTQTMVSKIDDNHYEVQVVSWYDNENSYTSQMVRTIKYFANVK